MVAADLQFRVAGHAFGRRDDAFPTRRRVDRFLQLNAFTSEIAFGQRRPLRWGESFDLILDRGFLCVGRFL